MNEAYGLVGTLLIIGLALIVEGITGAIKPARYWEFEKIRLAFSGITHAKPSNAFFVWHQYLAMFRVILGIIVIAAAIHLVV